MHLTGKEMKRLRRKLLCPDCTSTVSFSADRQQITVKHQDTCPVIVAARRGEGMRWIWNEVSI